ncbi:MAG: glycosyltransferase family 4 protein [Pseudomonadales bacterium]|nr:glycosyltransferase family 4 protein [Pseudomonadales bacterium]
MKVLVVYQYYQDRAAPGHSLVYELTQYLASRGHDVTVVSGETGYMDPSQPQVPWYRRLVRREREGGVTVLRTYTYSELHRSYIGRLLSFLSFSITCPLGLLMAGRHDVALASSPPIFPMFTAWLICKLRGIPFVLEVRDLWPASAVQMGVLKNRHLIAIMGWMEQTLYNRSRRIIALTEGIRGDICARGWPENKVALVTCGVDADQLYPDLAAGERLRQRFGWEDRKVILYFGALGEANNIPVILRAARRLEKNPDYLFVLVGNGMKREETTHWLQRNGVTNVQLLPPVPKEEARSYINAADLCLATLKDIPLFHGAIPTKLIDYMACGKPVLCGIRGEAQTIVEAAGGGVLFAPDADDELARLVTELAHDPTRCLALGDSGHAYVRERFSAATMRAHTESVLSEAISDSLPKVANGI